jgi:hypothetical protein
MKKFSKTLTSMEMQIKSALVFISPIWKDFYQENKGQ